MSDQPSTEWEFWASLRVSRLPLGLVLDPKNLAARTSGKELSDSAYVFRMFDLCFPVREPRILERLTDEEKQDVSAFSSRFDALPWTPLVSHLHISEIAGSDLSMLVPAARRLDRRLWMRTSGNLIPMMSRLSKGWPVFEPPLPRKLPDKMPGPRS
jgi:hypothetical protein